ncbi:MAG: HD domain-containing protein [Candidatus Aenigmarchaeota archaeon]|nr:HD domain-containing protein [Candidatus Aenigmarchaeota archaeon]
MSLIEDAKKFAVDKMGPDRLSGYPHAERVLKNARILQKLQGGDLELIEIAAIMHDVSFNGKNIATHATESANIAETFLEEHGVDFKRRQNVKKIIERHTVRDWTMKGEPETVEEKILFDAETIERVSMHGFLMFITTSHNLPYSNTGQVVRALEKFVNENYKSIFFEETKQRVQRSYFLLKTVIEEIRDGANLKP